jgi:uncharacterized protein YceK
MRRLLPITLVAMLIPSTGCGTVLNLSNDASPYGGVVLETKLVAEGVMAGPAAWTCDITEVSFWPLALVDLPASLVGDTLTLPFSLKAQHERQRAEKAQDSTPGAAPAIQSGPANLSTSQATNAAVAIPSN